VASLSQGRTAAAQCGLFTYKSVPVIFEPPCTIKRSNFNSIDNVLHRNCPVRRVNGLQTYGGEGEEEEARNCWTPSGKREDTKI